MWLIRRKLGLRKYEGFQFTNQKNDCIYYFTDDALMRENPEGYVRECHAGLNYLLSDECEIRKVCRFQRVFAELADEMERNCGDWQNNKDNPELRERILKNAQQS
jgi:hypothetical protein